MRRSHLIALALSLQFATTTLGCATPRQRARTLKVLGGITVASGLLVAGRCSTPNDPGRPSSSGFECSGSPDAQNAAKGMGIVGLGAAIMAAGAAMEPREEPRAVPSIRQASTSESAADEPACTATEAQEDAPEACSASALQTQAALKTNF